MKKAIRIIIILGIGFLFCNIIFEDDKYTDYEKIIEEHPFNKTMYLSKKERKSLGLTPNAYFEQEYLNEINPSTGRTHPENVFELQDQLNLYNARVPGESPENPWIERGPNNVGGRTRALLFDPNDETNRRVFAGGVSGGLWINNDIADANSSWLQVGISENVAVTCITVDPNNSQIMYIGTGSHNQEMQAQETVFGNQLMEGFLGPTSLVILLILF